MFIDADAFMGSVHAEEGCITCHNGVGGTAEKELAHEGVVRAPDAVKACICHDYDLKTEDDQTIDAVLADYESGLHNTLSGYYTILSARGANFELPEMQEAFDNHCATCHTDCSHCHLSRPTFSGGGLVSGHQFKKIAPLTQTCDACHSSRIANAYKGKEEGVKGDVHYLKQGMTCFDCHNVTELHGDGTVYAHRYDNPPSMTCLDCHPEAAPEVSELTAHQNHGNVACEVCHSAGEYKSCYNCHVQKNAEGTPYFSTDKSQMTFKIGRNPNKSETRPWDYVLLRHIPIVPNTFEYYGENMLPEFDNIPTWKYTTVHNIQKTTPRTEDCAACHGNAAIFLTADDVAPEELNANQSVIVEEIPPVIGE